jgi:hypothetical protein
MATIYGVFFIASAAAAHARRAIAMTRRFNEP